MITETWYSQPGESILLPKYNSFFLNRDHGRGGGVFALVRESLPCEGVSEYCSVTPDYEAMRVNIDGILLAVCYRPSRGNEGKLFLF